MFNSVSLKILKKTCVSSKNVVTMNASQNQVYIISENFQETGTKYFSHYTCLHYF